MSSKQNSLEREQKELVLARFKTLNPNAKLSLGGDKEITVKELIKNVEKGNEFGKKVVKVQMKMLKILSGAV